MPTRSQAELEHELEQRWEQVQGGKVSLEQAFSTPEDWITQLGERRAMLQPHFKQWMWYDGLHKEWVFAGCGPGEAILLSVGKLGGVMMLPQPDEVDDWCVFRQGQDLHGPLRLEELRKQLESQQVPKDILIWSTQATGWFAASDEKWREIISAAQPAANRISATKNGEGLPSPAAARKQPKQKSQRKQSPPPAPVAAPSSADATLIEFKPASVEVIVLSGELEYQRFPVGDQLRLGRGADNDLTLPDKKASHHHAILHRQGGVYQIIDLNSGNGTYVNGQRIVQPTPLKNGDIVLIGDTKLTINYQP